jgi:enamine deaminase RidA (YjgF/YER057c/UK114 family)
MSIYRHKQGARLAEAAVCNGMIFLAGQVPENTDADAQAQTANVLAQIDTLLAELGSDKSKILDVTIFLASLADYDAMNAAWDAWVPAGNVPARATVEAKLANPAWKVEIKLVAASRAITGCTGNPLRRVFSCVSVISETAHVAQRVRHLP